MPGLNLDDLQAALEPYTVTVDGTTYTAKELSFLEAIALKKRMATLDDEEAQVRLVLDALDFPTELILTRCDAGVVEALIEDFFAHRRARRPAR